MGLWAREHTVLRRRNKYQTDLHNELFIFEVDAYVGCFRYVAESFSPQLGVQTTEKDICNSRAIELRCTTEARHVVLLFRRSWLERVFKILCFIPVIIRRLIWSMTGIEIDYMLSFISILTGVFGDWSFLIYWDHKNWIVMQLIEKWPFYCCREASLGIQVSPWSWCDCWLRNAVLMSHPNSNSIKYHTSCLSSCVIQMVLKLPLLCALLGSSKRITHNYLWLISVIITRFCIYAYVLP